MITTFRLAFGEHGQRPGLRGNRYGFGAIMCRAPERGAGLDRSGQPYTGDTEWTENLLAVGRDADLLIAEALFFERRVKYHLDYASLKGNLERIGAKRVILTHMGPQMLSHTGDVREETAQDGMIVEF